MILTKLSSNLRPGHDGGVTLLYGEGLPDLQHEQHQHRHARGKTGQSHLEWNVHQVFKSYWAPGSKDNDSPVEVKIENKIKL